MSDAEEIFTSDCESMDIDYTITARENTQGEYDTKDSEMENLIEMMRKLSIDDYGEVYKETHRISEEKGIKRRLSDTNDRPKKISKLGDCE